MLSSYVANCSKTLLGKGIKLMLQTVQRPWLKNIILMLHTVQRPYLKYLLLMLQITSRVYSVDVTNCSKTLLGKGIKRMLRTVQRPCLQNIFFWCCKLFKNLTWNICSSDVANCSKTLTWKVYSVHDVQSAYLESVLWLMLQTVQRPCLKNISFRWCKLFKDLTWNICSSDVANWSKNLLKKCILLMLQTVQRPYLETVNVAIC